ncbi:1885_t:CDS:1, partial [Dentiscutata erythropus]
VHLYSANFSQDNQSKRRSTTPLLIPINDRQCFSISFPLLLTPKSFQEDTHQRLNSFANSAQEN